jgi:hypothetical protein
MNFEPTTTAGLALLLLYILANFAGKQIPDSATGVLGIVRKIAKIVALYVPNKQ